MAELTPVEMIEQLSAELVKGHGEIKKYSKYYEGKQPLRYMAPQLERELGPRITQLVLNWPRLGVDAYESRLDVEGFRVAGEVQGSEDLWQIWRANDLDEISQQAHLEALITGRSFVIVGPGEDPKIPLISVEHPSQVAVMRDPGTRRVTAAIKSWADDDDVQNVTLYQPDVTRYYRKPKNEFELQRRVDHGWGMVPVVPVVNRPRMLCPDGVSELADVVSIADAANKMATDMMVSAEFHAMPRRAWFGMSEEDFADEHGNPISVWSRIAGREWATEHTQDEAGVVQFAEADLRNFHESIKLLAQLASQVLALPPHYMGFATTNPPSADAIRSAEAQLVKRCERKQTIFGGAWERVMQIAARIAGVEDGRDLRLLETVWRNPATPTVAQKADAAVKLYTSGISTLEQTREDVGYTPAQRQNMADEDRKALERDPLAAFARQQEAVSAAGRAALQEQD